MKSLKELSTLIKVGTSMVKEIKESENAKKTKADLKETIHTLKNSEIPKKLVKDLVIVHKTRKQIINEILNSDEVNFIKTAVKESEKGKKVSETLETVNDMIPERIKIEGINYSHWCLNYYYITRMALSAPLPVIKGILKYSWIYDLLKSNSMATNQITGRRGANVLQMQRMFSLIVKDVCDIVKYNLVHPDKTVIKDVMIPAEILYAMDLHFMPPELQGTVLPKCDQFAGLRYLDATRDQGLPQDTCSYPRFAQGVALLDEMIPGVCMIASNLPCDGGMAAYEMIQQKLDNLPTYRLNVPYDFRNNDSIEMFVEDLKGMIKFLEENTGKKMDWDKLCVQCENYNKLVEIEYERWDMAMSDKPPLTNDAIWYPHEWCFNIGAGRNDITKFLEGQLKLNRKAYEKGQIAFKNMRYRTIVWNPPPAYYGPMWGWLEKCWGVGSVMDLESYGAMEHIDTTTIESMLKGLGKRYMWATMSKHTRGPAENMLGDFAKVIEDFKPDFVYLPAHIGCKNGMSLEAAMRDICRKMDVPFCVVRYELLDNRIASRQSLRDQFSKFMTEVMHAEPLDPSLLKIDDVNPGNW